jgi:hypothetical protein
MSAVLIPGNTPASQDGVETYATAAPFMQAIDNLDPTIPTLHRQVCVMLACGVSYRLVVAELGIALSTVLTWSRQYKREIETLQPIVKRLACDFVGGLVSDCMLIGSTIMQPLHAHAKAGKLGARDLLNLMQAGMLMADLADRIRESDAPRHDRAVSTTRDQALAALKSLKP